MGTSIGFILMNFFNYLAFKRLIERTRMVKLSVPIDNSVAEAPPRIKFNDSD